MVHASPASAKTVLRQQMRDLRKRLAGEAPDAAGRAATHLPPDLIRTARIVSGYRPRGAEIDPWPVMQAFARAGAQLALPVAFDRDSALAFRAYADGDPLEPDAFNTLSPTGSAPVVEPDLVIAPLLAFDRFGNRMGQGAGHYDRALQALRANRRVFVLGLAYAGQQVAQVPAEPHDQRLDAILTEKAYIEASKD
jgi:5-formyltetrahydrofolate cyclo-ligase